MEVLVAGEGLADQFGTDDDAVLLDQAAIGLAREQRLGDAGHAERIDQAGDDRERDDHDDRGSELFQHWSDPLREADGRDGHVDRLDADEGNDDAAEAIDQQVAATAARRRRRPGI